MQFKTLASAVALALVGLTSVHAAEEKSVAVTAIVEHPALDAVRDGIQDALKEAGYESGKNLKWQYQSAQGNTGTAAQIARKFIGDKPDAMYDIGITYAIDQIADLLANGVDGIHVYTMNNPYIAKKIAEAVKTLL